MNKDSKKEGKLQPRLQLKNKPFSEDESLTIKNSLFDKNSKTLILEKIHSKNKIKSKSEIDFKGVLPSRISIIHIATSNALEVSVDGMEAENMVLKERIKEL